MGNRIGLACCHESDDVDDTCPSHVFADAGKDECISMVAQAPFQFTPDPWCKPIGGTFFNDSKLLLERLEAVNHGDRVLDKLGKNTVFFANSAEDMVDGTLRLTQKPQVWASRRGRGDLLQKTLHDTLQQHALPPVRVLKRLQWAYRVEEIPRLVSCATRQCVLVFFSVMLAAGAAMKFHAQPPPTWQRRGIDPVEVLRGVSTRLPELIAGLRFLACVALLQQSDTPLLGDRKIIAALLKETRVSQMFARHGSEVVAPAKPSEILKADTFWDSFFDRASLEPLPEITQLVQDLQHLPMKSGVSLALITDGHEEETITMKVSDGLNPDNTFTEVDMGFDSVVALSSVEDIDLLPDEEQRPCTVSV